MRETTLWRQLLGVEKTAVIERVEYDPVEEIVIASVRPSGRLRPRCGKCGKRAAR